MKCPNCNKDGMVHSRAGWLCVSCGHLEPDTGSPAGDTKIAVGKASHDRMRDARKDEDAADLGAKHPSKIPLTPDEVIKPEPNKAEDTPTDTADAAPAPEPPHPAAPWEAPAAKDDDAKEPKPEESEKDESKEADEPDETDDKSTQDNEPEKPDNQPEPEEPKSAPEALVAETAPGTTAPPTLPLNGKPPLTPHTHPRPVNAKAIALVVIIFAIAAIVFGVGYAQKFLNHKPAATATPTPSPSPSVSISPSTSPSPSTSASPSSSPSATPTPSASANDAQRKTDLATYVTAYKATASGGYYSTNPPKVNVSATDPSTHQAYTIITTPPTTPGQIQYKAGGQCGGPGITPGKSSTRYVALYTKLESSATPYCLDVR
jgi:hypothetical protein